MSFTCHGICNKVEVSREREPYAKKKQFCTICQRYMLIYTARCLCCNNTLRTHEIHKKRGNDSRLLQ